MDEELARFAEEGPSPEEMERAQAKLSASGWTGWPPSAGRADELCRYAVLFGDPQLALTAVQRVLAVTPERCGRSPRPGCAPTTARCSSTSPPAAEPRTPMPIRMPMRRAPTPPTSRPPTHRPSRRARVSETAAVMTFHPQPQAGEPRPWAFPAPDRSTLGNGLTLLTQPPARAAGRRRRGAARRAAGRRAGGP